MTSVLIAILAVLPVLTVVVVVHELGHFWAARAFGVKVDQFSLGFGKSILSRRDKHGIEWRIGWLPLGGYVRFAGDEDATSSVPDADSLEEMRRNIVAREGPGAERKYFHFKPVWQRAIVVAAGPVSNFVLAILVFGTLYWATGETLVKPRIADVPAGSAAAAAGLKPGDVVVEMDGRPVRSLEVVQRTITLRSDTPIRFVVDRGGERVPVVVTPERTEIDMGIGGPQNLGDIGARFSPILVAAVEPRSPAALGGLKVGDLLLTVDGRSVGQAEFVSAVAARAGRPTALTVLRDGAVQTLTVTPRAPPPGRGALGASIGQEVERVRLGPLQAASRGVAQTWDVLTTTIEYLGRILTGRESGDQLGGPLRIAQTSGAIAQASVADAAPLWANALNVGFNLLQLVALLSVGIGFLNLLPIPVLDGGHLVFYAYEAVARRPLGAQVQAVSYRVGLVMLLGLMVFATWNDLRQLQVFQFLGGLL